MRFAVTIEYDGTDYHGWQLQSELPTVQGAVEETLERLFGSPVRVHGAGRTDSGVHALGQAAHFDATWAHSTDDLLKACNALLPDDIVFRTVRTVDDDFHARHSAVTKTYAYRIYQSDIRSPVSRRYAWHVRSPLSVDAMNAGAGRILGVHDFATFGQATDGTPSTEREMLKAEWRTESDFVIFAICGTGFLRYMVRSLVGTLVQVGTGKISPADFADALDARTRSAAGPTAPPQGLFLESVTYRRQRETDV